MKKLLTLFLALVMLFALAVPALASEKPAAEEQEPYYYFSMGDSIARCYHQENSFYDGDNSDNNGYGGCNAEFSYPYLIAEALGLDHNKQANFHYPGLRAKELYYGLGGDVALGVNVDGYDFSWHMPSLEALKPEFIDAAGKAKLITLQVGSNDFLYYATSVSGVLDNPSAESIAECVDLMWKGYNDFCEYYPKTIERILELQRQQKGTDEDVTIVLMGMYNSVGNAPMTDDLYLPLGNAVRGISDLINLKYKEWACRYGQIYVDLTGTETPLTSGEYTLMEAITAEDIRFYSHPTKEGYAYIARQILNALPENVTRPCPLTYIQLNLNTKFTVKKVKLGLLPAIYEQNGYALTVHNYSLLPTTMTVSGTNEDTGKEVVFVYSLLYKPGVGFVSQRLSSTIDLQKSIDRVKNAPFNLARSIAGLLK